MDSQPIAPVLELVSLSGVHPADFISFDGISGIPEGAYAHISLDDLLAKPDLADHCGKLAVTVAGDSHYEALAPVIDTLDLVCINFPVFSDGRGFSLAVRLRQNLKFHGEIRAVGHVLPDQAQYLLRAGFDSAEIPASRRAALERNRERFKHFYQAGVSSDFSVPHLRHGTTS